MGDSADGYPGISGWGKKAAAACLSRYPHLQEIPKTWQEWHSSIKKARSLYDSLFSNWEDALLFRTLATLRLDTPVFDNIDALRWNGPRSEFETLCNQLKTPALFRRAFAVVQPSDTLVRGWNLSRRRRGPIAGPRLETWPSPLKGRVRGNGIDVA